MPEGPRLDLIISDFMMPIFDGAGLIHTMRQTEAQRDIPCIVMSSMFEETVRERVGQYAAFVRKPFSLAAMVAPVPTVLEAPSCTSET